MRRRNQLIPRIDQFPFQVILDLFADRRSFGMPEDQPRSGILLDAEQVELFAQPTVVAALGLLDLVKEIVQPLLIEERSPIDALHGVAGFVALPIGARHREQLEGPNAPGGRDVGAEAEIEKIACLIS